MNIQHLRQNLKIKWLTYYKKNRRWLIRMRIWGTYDGSRRPSSGFILAAISALEPRLAEIFPFALDLNNNPDDIIIALGLNFNPEEHLHLVKLNDSHQSEYDSECDPEYDSEYDPKYDPKNYNSPKAVPINPVDTTFADKEVAKLHQKEETYDPKSSYPIPSAEDIRKELATWGASKKATVIPKPEDIKPKERLSDISITPVTEINTEQINREQIPGKLRNSKLVDDYVPDPQDITKDISPPPILSPTENPTQIHTGGNPKEAMTPRESRVDVVSPREAIADNSIDQNQSLTAESSQNTRVNKLVRWIDELCQGTGWEGDDIVVTPF